jgi:histidine triad (HIT) family protein
VPLHAPPGYECHFCAIAAGGAGPLTDQAHVILRTNDVTAFVNSHWWPDNAGACLVIPNEHSENLYELPVSYGGPILDATKQIATALKAVVRCHGVSTRQHNEPAGNQDVWHYHQHVFPRFVDDRLYERHREKAPADPDERLRMAAELRARLTLPG